MAANAHPRILSAARVGMRVIATPRLTLASQVAAHAAAMFVVLSDRAIYEFENAPPSSYD